MKRYMGPAAETFSRGESKIAIGIYVFFFMGICSFGLSVVQAAIRGVDLDGTPLTDKGWLIVGILVSIVGVTAIVLVIRRLRLKKKLGETAPKAAAFFAVSTSEIVPESILRDVLKTGTPLKQLQQMLKFYFLKNIVVDENAHAVRILLYEKIEVFSVRCEGCGAVYTMTSKDDYVCQYCSAPVQRID